MDSRKSTAKSRRCSTFDSYKNSCDAENAFCMFLRRFLKLPSTECSGSILASHFWREFQMQKGEEVNLHLGMSSRLPVTS